MNFDVLATNSDGPVCASISLLKVSQVATCGIWKKNCLDNVKRIAFISLQNSVEKKKPTNHDKDNFWRLKLFLLLIKSWHSLCNLMSNPIFVQLWIWIEPIRKWKEDRERWNSMVLNLISVVISHWNVCFTRLLIYPNWWKYCFSFFFLTCRVGWGELSIFGIENICI